IEIKKTNPSIELGPLPSLVVVPTQMRQLFQNLISNSIKFCMPGVFPQINIWSETEIKETVSPNDPQLVHKIIIRDNGMGFDQKFAEDIFIVFKRLHSYHEIEGTGIGLSICKKIIEKHKGEIKAVSSPGNGSTFIISLPAKT